MGKKLTIINGRKTIQDDRVDISVNQTSHGFTVGQPIYYNGISWALARANLLSTTAQYVVSKVVDTNNFEATKFGNITSTSHGFTVGQTYYTDETTPGNVTTTEPDISSPVFIVIDANTLLVSVTRAIDTTAGGGGSTDTKALDIFHQNTFESYTTGNSSGNNATFLGGGTLDGTDGTETTNPISGDASFKYTASTSSTNDYIEIGVIDLDIKQRSEGLKCRLIADMSNFGVDVDFVIWDKTNSKPLTFSGIDILSANASKAFYEIAVTTSLTCTQISYGIHIKNAPTNGDSLIIDSVEFSTSPFLYKQLFNVYDIEIRQQGTNVTDRVGNVRFNLASLDHEKTSVGISVTDNGAETIFAPIGAGIMQVSWSYLSANTGEEARIRHYDKDDTLKYEYRGYTVGSAINTHAVAQFEVEKGDYVIVYANNGVRNSVNDAVVHATLLAYTEYVIVPAKSSMTPVTEYAPSSQGFGTLVASEVFYQRVGGMLHLFGWIDAGTTTADEARIYLPTVDGIAITVSSIINDPGGGGAVTGTYYRRQAVDQRGGPIMADGGNDYITFGDRATFSNQTGITPTNNENGNAVLATGQNLSFYAIIPIEEWDSDAVFLGAIPINRTAYLKDLKASGTSGGTFTSGAWQTRTLNTIEGDSSFLDLDTNEFTLTKGIYDYTVAAPAAECITHKARLYNVTDGAIQDDGINQYAPSGNATTSIVKGRITITEPKTFRVEHRCSTTRNTNGFGPSTSFGDDEVYTVVEITKVK